MNRQIPKYVIKFANRPHCSNVKPWYESKEKQNYNKEYDIYSADFKKKSKNFECIIWAKNKHVRFANIKDFISGISYTTAKKRVFTLFFAVAILFISQNLTFADNYTEIPKEVIEYAYKKGYETPQRIWYLPNICIKNIIYTDTYYVQKKNNNKKYRYILYNKEHLRFATKSEQFKYLESGYF